MSSIPFHIEDDYQHGIKTDVTSWDRSEIIDDKQGVTGKKMPVGFINVSSNF